MKDKKNLRKILTLVLCLLSLLSYISCNIRRLDEGTEAPLDKALKTYYYAQLEENSLEQKFYKAIKYMYDEGLFKKGTESIDVVEKKFLTQSDVDDNASNSMILVYAMGGARDAFVLDYPEVFYVNFDKLSIRVLSQQKDGKKIAVCLLGIGRSTDYFADGFTDKSGVETAINEYNTLLENAISTAKAKSTIKEKITDAHDYLVNNFEYKLEIYSGVKDVNTLRSVYGGLKNKQGMCETFAKTFKVMMDALNIPCISIIGKTYDEGDTVNGNPHMWNNVYVEIDGLYWYAVDTTYDQGKKASTYLFADQTTMKYHIPDKLVSEANYPFYYPSLYVKKETSGPFTSEKYVEDGVKYFKVSYNGKGIKAAQKAYGVYLLVNYKSDISKEYGDWAYLYLADYPDYDDYFLLPYETLGFLNVKFASTTKDYDDKAATILSQYTHGDQYLSDETNELTNENPRVDLPGPYAMKVSPHSQEKLAIGQTYSVTCVFDEDLEITGNFSLTIDSSATVTLADTKYEELTFTAPRTITFKFTTSKKYAANSMDYYVYFNGIVGKITKKSPYHISFFVLNASNIGCPLKYGSTYSVYGQVQLLENADLSTKGWEVNGTSISNDLSFGVSLVVSKPSTDVQNTIDGELSKDSNLVTSSTYDIGLTLCCCQVKRIPYGQRMKIMLPFPDGYGPNDAGVDFKAYHYNNSTKQMEEVECMINESGVIIYVNSFSPFTLAVVKSDSTSTTKKIASLTGEGGKVDQDLVSLEAGQSATFTYTPKDNFVIDYVLLNGELQQTPTDNKITFKYEDLTKKSNFLEAYFIPSATKEEEKTKGYSSTPIIPTAEALNVSISRNDSTNELGINVQGKSGSLLYTWYKNNEVKNNTDSKYTLNDGENGIFKVSVTNTVLRSYKISTSNEIQIIEESTNASDIKKNSSNYMKNCIFNYLVWCLLILIL